MIEFTNIKLVNALVALCEAAGDYGLFEEGISLRDEKELAGWLLFESEQDPDAEIQTYWHELDILVQASYIKKGVAKYE